MAAFPLNRKNTGTFGRDLREAALVWLPSAFGWECAMAASSRHCAKTRADPQTTRRKNTGTFGDLMKFAYPRVGGRCRGIGLAGHIWGFELRNNEAAHSLP